MYWTVLDFGNAIAQEDAWLTVTTTKTDDVQEMFGGCTQLYSIVMRSFDGSVSGSFRDGIILKIGERQVLVFGEISMLLATSEPSKTR